MKQGTKTFLGITISAIAAAAVAAIFKKAVKKEEARLSKQRDAEDKEIEEGLGVSPERMRSQVLECEREADRNMVKAMYVGIESNPDWNEDVIDVEKALSTETILHITEEERERGKDIVKYLNFIFEIPDLSGTRGYNDPRIGDYYTSMKQLKEYLWSRIILYCEKPYGNMAVYMAYSYKNPRRANKNDHALISEVLEVPKSVWSQWADEHDGVVEFFHDAEENGLRPACEAKGVWDIIEDLISQDIEKKNPDVEDLGTISPRPEELRLMYKMSFRESDGGDFGIDVQSALKCLKYISDNFSVTRKGSEVSGTVYDRFMFHAPNDDGEYDSLVRYYTSKNGQVVHDQYSYPDEEEADYSKVNNVFNAAKHSEMDKTRR